MVLFNNDLYAKIICKEALESDCLRIISGYASADFLIKVKQEFPQLKIDLFIGMSQEGISINTHKKFKEIMIEFSDVQVYYQFEEKNTHIKLIEFSNKVSKVTYVGSANFTENGFFNNQELMVPIGDYTESLFEEQKRKSLLCNVDNIARYINFFEEESNLSKSELIKNQKFVKTIESMNMEIKEIQQKQKRYLSDIQKIRSNINYDYYKKFSIEIILNEENDRRWRETGINRIFKGEIPSLFETNKNPFFKLFPEEQIFSIFADDGNMYQAQLTGMNKKDLILLNGNFYEYVQKKIGLNEYRVISRQCLESFGVTKINFERLSESEYYMYFV